MKRKLLFGLILSLVIFQVYYYIKGEDPVYYWDGVGYERIWACYSQYVLDDFFGWIKKILINIDISDYNVSPIIPIIPFYYIPIENKRLAFILGIMVLYLFPLSILIGKIFNNLNVKKSKNGMIIVVFISSFFVGFWRPSLGGLPDIVGLIPIVVIILFLMENDLSSQISLQKAIILGILLWLPFLFRRWYLYTIISLYLTLPVFNYYLRYKLKKICLKNLLLNFLMISCVNIILILLFQFNMFKRVLYTDYSYIYSAYQNGIYFSFFKVFNNLKFLLPFFIIGLMFSFLVFFNKKDDINNYKEKIFGVFCFFNLIISLFLFIRTQTPEYHHMLPFLLWALLLSIIGLRFVIKIIRNVVYKKIFIFIVVLIYGFVFIITFNRIGKANFFSYSFLPSKSFPLKKENFENYKLLTITLDSLLKKNETISVISSGSVLNEDLLITLSNSNPKSKLKDKIIFISQVDLRDKINLSFLQADYLIVTDPIDTHLGNNYQRVITIPANQINKGVGIGKAYKKLNIKFVLEKNYKAYIYKKNRPLTYEEVDNFINEFLKIYPEWDSLYNNPLQKIFYTAKFIKGDKWGGVSFISNENKINAHPGESYPTRIFWNFHNIQNLTFVSYNTTCDRNNSDGVNITLKNDFFRKDIYLNNGDSIKINVVDFRNKEGEIIIDKNVTTDCDGIYIKAD